MKVTNLKTLRAVIKLCRETGVDAIQIDGIHMNFGPDPRPKASNAILPSIQAPTLAPGGITEDTRIPTDGLTEEQLLMWSVGADSSQQ